MRILTVIEKRFPKAASVSLDLDIVVVPAGSFWMGESRQDKFATENERPRHHVTFKSAFGFARFPVTVGEYRLFDPEHALDDEADLPVVNVTWNEASAFCEWLSELSDRNVRLPSEAEWEYACRAGTQTCFSTGDSLSLDQANFLYSEQGERIGPGRRSCAGTYPQNPYGLYDLAGNVGELTADTWHSTYVNAPTDGSAWLDGDASTRRVIRGGAWDHLPRLLRCASRDSIPTNERRDNLGFRVAVTLP